MHRNIGNLSAGTTVSLEVWRDEGDGKLKQLTVPVVLGERPDDKELEAGNRNLKVPTPPGTKPDDPLLGMKLEPSTTGKGLEVKAVSPKTPVAGVGVEVGDIILEVNRKSVSSVADFKEALKASNTGSHLLYIERDGTAMLQMVPGD